MVTKETQRRDCDGGEKVAMEAPRVRVESSMGTFVVELYHSHAPKTCKNFEELVKRQYYDGVVFHRIIPNFMIQGGDPTGTGRGGESIYGGKFEDEVTGDLKHTGAGVLSMANSGPNSNGSQFFITLAPTSWLDGKYMKSLPIPVLLMEWLALTCCFSLTFSSAGKHTIFGRVCEGKLARGEREGERGGGTIQGYRTWDDLTATLRV